MLREERARRRRELKASGSRRMGERPPYRSILTAPIVAFVIMAFTSHFAMGGFEVVWSLWLRHLGASLNYISYTWVVFSVPMLLSFAGGMLADRYSRFWLMFGGYTISAFAWVVYGTTTNLTLFIVVNVHRGPGDRLLLPGEAGLPHPGEPAALARHGDGYRDRRPCSLPAGSDR